MRYRPALPQPLQPFRPGWVGWEAEERRSELRRRVAHIGHALDRRVLPRVEAHPAIGLLREQRAGGWLNFLQYLSGRIPVSATGTVSSGSGIVELDVEAISFAGIEVPVLVLQELVRHYTRTQSDPGGMRLDQALTLPFGIRELRLSAHEAVVVQ